MQTREAETYPANQETVQRPALTGLFVDIDRLYATALVLIGAVAAGIQFNDQLIGLTGDNTEYILLGLSFVTRQPYTNAEYPWGYPALISPILAVFGPDNVLAAIPWLKLLTIALFLVSLVLIYYVLRRTAPPWVAFLAGAFFAINSTVLLYANDVMTEIPYTCASFGALLFWQRRIEPQLQERGWPRSAWLDLLVVGLLIALPYYLRTVVLALIGAAVLAVLFRGRVKQAVVLGAFLLAVALPWIVFSNGSAQGNYLSKVLLRDPYNPSAGRISSPLEFTDRLLQGTNLYLNLVFPAMILPDPTPASVRSLVSPVLSTLMVLGLGLRLFRHRRMTEIYAVLFLLILSVWPWKADRFLLPLYPLLLYYTIYGLMFVARQLWLGLSNRVVARGVVAAAVVLFALPNLWLAGTAGAQNLSYLRGTAPASGHTPDWQAYFAACDWLKNNTPPGSVVISRKSTITEVFADRPSVLIPLIKPSEYPGFIEKNHVTYILEDAFSWSTQTQQYLRPALQADLGILKLVHTTAPPFTRIWQVVR